MLMAPCALVAERQGQQLRGSDYGATHPVEGAQPSEIVLKVVRACAIEGRQAALRGKRFSESWSAKADTGGLQ